MQATSKLLHLTHAPSRGSSIGCPVLAVAGGRTLRSSSNGIHAARVTNTSHGFLSFGTGNSPEEPVPEKS
jgi:hypothetical protein